MSITKPKTKQFEFLKCPINPQQNVWSYVKLNKKSLGINDVLRQIEKFYDTHIKIEQIIDIADDGANFVNNIRIACEKQSFTWAHLLGANRKFAQIIEGELNGFKTYQLVFGPVN